MCVCVCACVRACMRACLRACVHACVRVCVCACECVRVICFLFSPDIVCFAFVLITPPLGQLHASWEHVFPFLD